MSVPSDRRAAFVPGEGNLYLPANRVATLLADRMGKMRLDDRDLLAIKSKGFLVTLTNGEEIIVGVNA